METCFICKNSIFIREYGKNNGNGDIFYITNKQIFQPIKENRTKNEARMKFQNSE